jgi:carboxymethylenebutenolidase
MELFGVDAGVRDVCDRLAGLGVVALAPDFHHRTAPGSELSRDPAGRERGFELLGLMTQPPFSATCAPPWTTFVRSAANASAWSG